MAASSSDIMHRRSSSLSKTAVVMTPPSTPPMSEPLPAFDVAESLNRLMLDDDHAATDPTAATSTSSSSAVTAVGTRLRSTSASSVGLVGGGWDAAFGSHSSNTLAGASSPEPGSGRDRDAAAAVLTSSSSSDPDATANHYHHGHHHHHHGHGHHHSHGQHSHRPGLAASGWGQVWSLSTSAWFRRADESAEEELLGAAAQPMYTLTQAETSRAAAAAQAQAAGRTPGGETLTPASDAQQHRRQRSWTQQGPHDDGDESRGAAEALSFLSLGSSLYGMTAEADQVFQQGQGQGQAPSTSGSSAAGTGAVLRSIASPAASASFTSGGISPPNGTTGILPLMPHVSPETAALAMRAAAGRGRRREALAAALPGAAGLGAGAAAHSGSGTVAFTPAPAGQRHSYLFVDNGNVFVGAQSMPDGSMDLAVRVNVKELASLLEGHTPCALREVAASRPSNPRICAAWSKIRYHVHNDTRAGSARQTLGDRIFETLIDPRLTQQPQTLTLATGDGSHFPQLVEVALGYGWHVVIWSWNRCLSEKFRKLANEHPDNMEICLFDEHRHRITFRAADRKAGDADGDPTPGEDTATGQAPGAGTTGQNARPSRRQRARAAAAAAAANGGRARGSAAHHGGPGVRQQPPQLPSSGAAAFLPRHLHGGVEPHMMRARHPAAVAAVRVPCYMCHAREGNIALGACQHVHLCRDCFNCANWRQCPMCHMSTQAAVYTDLSRLRMAPMMRYPSEDGSSFAVGPV